MKRYLFLFIKFFISYCLILFSVVYLQFSKREIEFEYKIQDIMLSVFTTSNNIKDSNIVRVFIKLNDIDFLFGGNKPVKIDKEILEIKKVEKLANGFIVKFNHNINFIITSKSVNQRSVYYIQIDNSTDKDFSFHFNIKRGNSVKLRDDFAGLLIENNQDIYLLTLPDNSKIDIEQKYITISSKDVKNNKTILGLSVYNPNQNKYLDYQKDISEFVKDYDTVYNDYISKSYQGFKTLRQSLPGKWVNPYTSEVNFDNDILIALLSQSILQGDYIAIQNQMRATFINNKLNYRSGVFLGDMQSKLKVPAYGITANSLLDAIKKDDFNSIFIKDIFLIALSSFDYSVYKKLLDYTLSIDFKSLDFDKKIILLSYAFLEKSDFIKKDLKELRNNLNESFILEIQSNVEFILDKYFIKKSQGVIDSYISILCGLILINSEQNQNVELGMALLKSAYLTADNIGFIPKNMEFFENKLISQTDNISPENLYSLITKNKYYPHYDFFNNGNSVLYSYSINKVNINKQGGDIKFSFENNPNLQHYIYVFKAGNIDNQTGLTLFDRVWKNDISFEQYSKGRYYSQKDDTLMIKFSSQSRQESFIIHGK